jgi:hypothetical protein
MKRYFFIIVTLFVSPGLRAQSLQQMAHPGIEASHLQFTHENFHVEPVRVEPIGVESLRATFEEDRREPEHLNFGSQSLTEVDSINDNFEQTRRNHDSEFSNMRMQFENPNMEHLNFNVQ